MRLEAVDHIFSDRDYAVQFAVRNPDGTDVDWSTLTAIVIRFIVKKNKDDADSASLIHKSTTSGIVMDTPLFNPVTGTITLSKSNTADSQLPEGEYHWELIHESTELGRVELFHGLLQVTESVVKDTSALPAEN